MPDEDELTPEHDDKEPGRLKARIAELEATLAERDNGLEQANTRINELERTVSESADRINNLNNWCKPRAIQLAFDL